MTAITLNLSSGAVSEYAGFNFQSITPTHAVGPGGLFALGGNADAGQPIVSTVRTSHLQWGSSLKKSLSMVYLAMQGTGSAELTVFGESASYAYRFPVRAAGESRCPPGRGIRENYLSFGIRNPDGEHFELDAVEVELLPSKTRKV